MPGADEDPRGIEGRLLHRGESRDAIAIDQLKVADDPRLIRRNGIVTQGWLEPRFSGDRFTLGERIRATEPAR